MFKHFLLLLVLSSCAATEKNKIITNREIAADKKKTVFIYDFQREEVYGSLTYPNLGAVSNNLQYPYNRNYYRNYYNPQLYSTTIDGAPSRDYIDMKKEFAANLEKTGCFKVIENEKNADYVIEGVAFTHAYDENYMSFPTFIEMLTLLPLINILPTRESFSGKSFIYIHDKNDLEKKEKIEVESFKAYKWLMRHSVFSIEGEGYKKKEQAAIADVQDVAAAKLAERFAKNVCF